jgi:hypothetical protein
MNMKNISVPTGSLVYLAAQPTADMTQFRYHTLYTRS